MESLNELEGEVADEVKDQISSVYDEFYGQIDSILDTVKEVRSKVSDFPSNLKFKIEEGLYSKAGRAFSPKAMKKKADMKQSKPKPFSTYAAGQKKKGFFDESEDEKDEDEVPQNHHLILTKFYIENRGLFEKALEEFSELQLTQKFILQKEILKANDKIQQLQ